MQVYLRESPRAVILVASALTGQDRDRELPHTALVLSTHDHAAHQSGSSSSAGHSRAVIEMVSTRDIPELVSLRKLHAQAFGCLGLINVGPDLFVGIIDSATFVGNVRPGEPVMRIASVAFYCLNKALWDENAFREEDGYGGPLDPQGPAPLPHEPGYAPPASGQAAITEHPCASIRKLLANGTFYFAQDGCFDLSRRLDQRVDHPARQGRQRKESTAPVNLISPVSETAPSLEVHDHPDASVLAGRNTFKDRFVWNTYMMEALQDYRSRLDLDEQKLLDRENLLTPVIQGYAGAFEVGTATIALISRLSWKRAGTRYATRGIDDDGNVANFAESETLYTYQGTTMSYCQVRGSVPLFWEQQGLQTFNARIQITRSRIASQPAFDRHFVDLLAHYKHVHALNLLGTRDAEMVLTSAYAEHMRNCEAEEVYLASLSKEDGVQEEEEDPIDRIGLTNFDFHSTARVTGGLDGVKTELKRLGPVQLKKQAFRYSIVDRDDRNVHRQRGVFRTNCLDCLDRTNVAQDILSQDALQLCIDRAGKDGLPDAGSALWVNHRVLWAENGDALSRIYAGTGALNSTFTRTGVGKKTLGGLLSDAAKSASRLYINNFQDKSKQTVIDALLGNMANQRPVSVFDPIHDTINAELNERLDEFSTPTEVTVYTGTWNLAGRGPNGEDLQPFLFPTNDEPDVLAIGLQEVVPLTPQQILLTDPEKLRYWEATILDTVAKRPGKVARYIPLRSEQLVGTALIILIRDTLLPHIRQVEAATKKTGLKGMSGNKGGVAIRMNIHDTSFCFVTAHFAAGKSNVDERNADFMTISRELAFHSGRTINNSHHAFWLGDFNYRIDGGNEIVRPLCDRGDLEELWRRDQLLRAQAARQAFVGYAEGTLVFLPTYKYDFQSQAYDTSEKMRVPAWTDRILFKSQHPFEAKMLNYDRAELFTSDHRPVYAVFRADARVYDNEKRNALRRELLAKYKSNQSRNGALAQSLYHSEDEHVDMPDDGGDDGYATDELPDPSGATHSWYDEPLSSESSDLGGAQSDSSDEEQRPKDNPFARRRSVQYARRPQTDSTRSGHSSLRGVSPLPPSSAAAGSNKSPSVTETPTSPESAKTSGSQTRRPAPEPPKRLQVGKPYRFDSPSSISSLAAPSPGIPAKPVAPPPIPSKPSHVVARASSGGVSSTSGEPVNAADRPTPHVPSRPGLGPRSQSYQSGKSQRSLLDDSD